jgi:hypothetical protein
VNVLRETRSYDSLFASDFDSDFVSDFVSVLLSVFGASDAAGVFDDELLLEAVELG